MDKINKCFLLIQNNRLDEAIKIIEQSDLTIQQDAKFTLMGIIESKQNNYSHSIKHFKNALNLSIILTLKNMLGEYTCMFRTCHIYIYDANITCLSKNLTQNR